MAEGRAEWIGGNQLRLLPSHPKNIAAAERAKAWEADYRPTVDADRTTQALRTFGAARLIGIDHATTRFQPLPVKAPSFDNPKRLVIRDRMASKGSQGDLHHDAVLPNGLPAKWRTVNRSLSEEN